MKNQNKKVRFISVVLFYLYIILLSYFLFFSERYGRVASEEYRYNIEFFREIKRFILYRREVGFRSFLINIVGNIAAFVPFGFYVPMMVNRFDGWFRITFLTALFSLSVELTQLVFRVGSFDVDDIILNTAGGIIGYLIYRGIRSAYSHWSRRKTKR